MQPWIPKAPIFGYRPGTAGNPQGLSDSPGLSQNGTPNLIQKSGKAINQSFYVIIRTTGAPQPATAMNVPDGSLVTIRAHNGTANGNGALVSVSQQPEILNGAGGDPITPDSDITWPCDHTGQVWVLGNAGDGIRISIQASKG